MVWLWKVTDTRQTQKADIYRTSMDPVCPLCDLLVNVIVKYYGRFSCWLQVSLSHHLRFRIDSLVFASTCGTFCVAHYTKANEGSIFVRAVHHFTFEVTSLQRISKASRRGRQRNFQKKAHLQERKKGEQDECEARWRKDKEGSILQM